MSDSVRPHRWQPTRLPHPWDSPGKNTGVGCHFLLQCMKVKSERSRSVMSDSWRPHGLQPTRLLCPWDFPGKSTGVGCHCLLQKTHLVHVLDSVGHVGSLSRLLFLLPFHSLENPVDGGAWWAPVHRVAKSQIRLSNFTFTFHYHALEKEMATHSSVFAWRILGTGEPGGLSSLGSHRVGHD